MPLGFCTAVKAPLILRSDLLVASRRMGCVALMVRDGAEEAPSHHEAPLILALPVVRRLAGLRHLAGLREFLRRHGCDTSRNSAFALVSPRAAARLNHMKACTELRATPLRYITPSR